MVSTYAPVGKPVSEPASLQFYHVASTTATILRSLVAVVAVVAEFAGVALIFHDASYVSPSISAAS